MDVVDKLREVERIVRMLRTAMRLLGFTNREIERRLGYTPSYLTRLFGGQIELRFEHVLDIVDAMGMTVDEFFRFSYPDRGEKLTEAAERLDGLLEELRPTPWPPRKPPLWEREDFKIAMQDAAERMLREVREERRKRREARPLEEELPEPRPRRELRQLPPVPEPARPPARRGPKKKAPA